MSLVALSLFMPSLTLAFSFGDFFRSFFSKQDVSVKVSSIASKASGMKIEPLLSPATNENPQAGIGIGGVELQYVGENSLLPAIGPLGNIAEADEIKSYRITTYRVRDGDSLSEIADTFGVSIGTIFWANNIKSADLIRPGDVLIILPVSGARHVVIEGDTIDKIAEKYKADENEILKFNDISAGSLVLGQEIIIPNVDLKLPAPAPLNIRKVKGGGPYIAGYFERPVNGGVKSQGLHGYNAVDLAIACGTPVYASASGNVITAKKYGWNAGYGKYVAVAHPNGTQTVYAHLQSVLVGPGWYVRKGQTIGIVGSTGRSTGCHVHFEIRGARNPF